MTLPSDGSDWSDSAASAWADGWLTRSGDPIAATLVCFSESNCAAKPIATATNPHRAAGLNQIVNLAAVGFHGDANAYESLTIEEQLPYVFRYFDELGSKLPLNTIARLYVANFEPAYLAHADDGAFVLCGERPGDPHPDYYSANFQAFDPGKKGFIVVSDLVSRVARVTSHNARCDAIVAKVQAAIHAIPIPPGVDVAAVQQGLNIQGTAPPLTVDGVAGPKTNAAILAFEGAHAMPAVGLTVAFAALLARILREKAATIVAVADKLDGGTEGG